MEASTSQCSSGCESGWTMYFDQYSDSANQYNINFSRTIDEEDSKSKGEYISNIDEDEDLSMVSDASSGPPHHISINSQPSEYRKLKQEKKGKDKSYCLDDTASSSVMGFSKGNSTLRKHFGFFKPSVKGKATSEKSVRLQGRKK